MPFLYLLNFINIINLRKNKNIAIIIKDENNILNQIIQDQQTDRLLYHGFIIDYIKGSHIYEISYEDFNFIVSNQYKNDIINIIVENNSIYFLNKNKNIKKEIYSMNITRKYPIKYTNVDIYI
jgi:hypothetical protein